MDIEKWFLSDKIFENSNVKIYKNRLTGETSVEFKPNCDKKVIEIWAKLNKPVETKL